MSLKVLVFYGSVRSDRQGIKAAKFIQKKLEERGNKVRIADPKEYDFGLLNKMYKEYEKGSAPEKMQELSEHITRADAFIVVSGEYNHTMPPALTNIMDYFQSEYHFKPAGIVTYSAGGFGGVRGTSHLRAFLGELGMVTPSIMLAVSKVQDAIDDEGNAKEDYLNSGAKRFLDEVEWYANALKDARENGTPY